MNLQTWIDQARAHWREYQAERFRQLSNAGILESTLQYAAEQTFLEVTQFEAAGFQSNEAFQMVRENYLFPPETPAQERQPISHEMVAAVKSGRRSMSIS